MTTEYYILEVQHRNEETYEYRLVYRSMEEAREGLKTYLGPNYDSDDYVSFIGPVSGRDDAEFILSTYGYVYNFSLSGKKLNYVLTTNDILEWDRYYCNYDCGIWSYKDHGKEVTMLTMDIFVPISMEFDSDEDRKAYAKSVWDEKLDIFRKLLNQEVSK